MRIDLPSARLRLLFALSVAVMFVHKVECWFAREWLESPFFAWLVRIATERATSPEDALGGAMFLVFVFWLFVGLAMVLCVLRGGPGPLVALAGWGLTFVLEWHHVVRTVGSGEYYPGIVTALPYLAIGPFYWREWARHLHWHESRGRDRGPRAIQGVTDRLHPEAPRAQAGDLPRSVPPRV